MPAIKEAAVEVDTNAVIPELVTKDVPKCVSLEEVKKDVADAASEETKASIESPKAVDQQDAEVTSSEVKSEDSNGTNKKTEDGDRSEVTESFEKDEKPVEVAEVDGKAENGATTTAANGKKLETPSDSNATDEAVVVDSSKGEVTNPDSAEVDVPSKPDSADEQVPKTAPAGSAEDLVEKAAQIEPAQTIDEEAPKQDKIQVPVEEAAKPKVEAIRTDGDKTEEDSAEAAAETSKSPEEEMVVDSSDIKPESKVTGSDEANDAQTAETEEPKKESRESADSTSEAKPAENPTSGSSETPSGSSSSTETKPDVLAEIDTLKKQGLAQYVQRNFCAAADSFGKVLELQAPLYGEMSEKLAETYFLYGSAMYEYGKTENTVLGENVKEKDEVDEDEEEGDGEEEKMDVENESDKGADSSEADKDEVEDAEGKGDETVGGEEKEDEDEAFRVSWEMLELAKTTFKKGNNLKRLADTLMKLGEVGIETGNAEAISEMLQGLEVRKQTYPENHRIVPETHFNIGVAFAYFEKYDDAIKHFTEAKSCLEKRIEVLSKSEVKEDIDEIGEMKQILPDIEEKIKDTQESKADKEKIKEETKSESSTTKEVPFPAASESKPASDISHLVRRKRKVDDIAEERAAKQSRQDGEGETASSTTDAKGSDVKIDDPAPSTETKPAEVTPEETSAAPESAPESTTAPESSAAPETTPEATAAPETTPELTAAPETTTEKTLAAETKTETNEVEKMEE